MLKNCLIHKPMSAIVYGDHHRALFLVKKCQGASVPSISSCVSILSEIYSSRDEWWESLSKVRAMWQMEWKEPARGNINDSCSQTEKWTESDWSEGGCQTYQPSMLRTQGWVNDYPTYQFGDIDNYKARTGYKLKNNKQWLLIIHKTKNHWMSQIFTCWVRKLHNQSENCTISQKTLIQTGPISK